MYEVREIANQSMHEFIDQSIDSQSIKLKDIIADGETLNLIMLSLSFEPDDTGGMGGILCLVGDLLCRAVKLIKA